MVSGDVGRDTEEPRTSVYIGEVVLLTTPKGREEGLRYEVIKHRMRGTSGQKVPK
jgi:hypothetical protein